MNMARGTITTLNRVINLPAGNFESAHMHLKSQKLKCRKSLLTVVLLNIGTFRLAEKKFKYADAKGNSLKEYRKRGYVLRECRSSFAQ